MKYYNRIFLYTTFLVPLEKYVIKHKCNVLKSLYGLHLITNLCIYFRTFLLDSLLLKRFNVLFVENILCKSDYRIIVFN